MMPLSMTCGDCDNSWTDSEHSPPISMTTKRRQIVQRLTNDTEPRPHARLISIEHTQPVTEANFENRSVPSSADPYHGRLVSVSHPSEQIQNSAAQEAYRVRDLRLVDTELLELAGTGRLHKPFSRVAGVRVSACFALCCVRM